MHDTASAIVAQGSVVIPGVPAAAPLGIYTSIASTQSGSDSSTEPQTSYNRGEALCKRFALQAAARQLLPRERVSFCLRLASPDLDQVHVLYSPSGKSAHYGGVCVCGSIWMCPVCAAKISERRRKELSQGVTNWFEKNGHALLVTFTLRHNSSDALQTLLEALRASFRAFKSGRIYKDLSVRHNIAGSVTALEVTHGVNGWHPHLHMLVFVPAGVQLGKLTHDLKTRWSQVVKRHGQEASYKYGVDVRAARQDIGDYVAKFGREPKWTTAHELAKAVSKKGRAGGRSALDLLAAYAFDDDQNAGSLWRLYAITMTGRNHLTWSRGLRSLLDITLEEKTDLELATEHEEIAVVLASLTHHQWRIVLGNDARAELLNVASSGDASLVHSFLQSLGVVSPQSLILAS